MVLSKLNYMILNIVTPLHTVSSNNHSVAAQMTKTCRPAVSNFCRHFGLSPSYFVASVHQQSPSRPILLVFVMLQICLWSDINE